MFYKNNWNIFYKKSLLKKFILLKLLLTTKFLKILYKKKCVKFLQKEDFGKKFST